MEGRLLDGRPWIDSAALGLGELELLSGTGMMKVNGTWRMANARRI